MQTNAAAIQVNAPTTARIENRFNQLIGRIQSLPLPNAWQRRLITLGVGLTVPYLSTSQVEFAEVGDRKATLRLRNRRAVQNHMKTVHASAMFLLAEAATGAVLSANLPEGSRFSTTHIEIDYQRRSEGDLQAVAELSDEQRQLVRTEPKGRLTVPVRVTDQSGNVPATFVVEWAWKHPSRAQSKL